MFRDRERFIFYMDNYSAQNKNWTLYTAMVSEVNRMEGPQEIIFRYLEPGHTFMSADSFLAQVEKCMRERKHVYDEDDFTSIINAKGSAVPMSPADFIMYENGVSQGKYTNKPLLCEVQEVRFNKGSTMLYWKSSIDDTEYSSGEFLKKKIAERIMRCGHEVTFPRLQTAHRIQDKKKNDILTKLCKFMPANRHAFWERFAVNDGSVDLIDNY
ncbi:uncharacterized protein LOC117115750 isoform X2 [Anneissia japonica]|uniref:uncharacterized protein LOC117115750 isoform X1 n=1 Tax=Anneissia japonica TaxID=1529436 RepID=UPI001425AF9E|nr:uncharacterized protein LOC117115750 isoform X1 [Anneissia japonica]XP_033115567.1 uncharacterized protein LOC117115750 isoform X2 [Anneissia japonica]